MSLLNDFGTTYKERVERAIVDFKAHKGVLLVDDEDRENEGDLIYPAHQMTSEDMALMIRECSGIVCLCLTNEKCEHLGLPPMVKHNDSKNQTAFTISIEAKEGVTTGVSAQDRIQTIQTAVNENSKAGDLAHPGHVFPLRARENGVFDRRGHTEGSVDLVKLAGLGDASVLCELTNVDGSMSKLPDIVRFAEEYKLTVLSVEDIYQYRKHLQN